MEWNLEERLVSQVAMFARQNQMGYSMKNNPSEESAKIRIIEIELLDYSNRKQYSQGRTVFRHFVTFGKDLQIASQRTSHVGENKSDRQSYIRFLDFLRKYNIQLTNDFENLWRDNPEKYPF
jgi:hypothetical protein